MEINTDTILTLNDINSSTDMIDKPELSIKIKKYDQNAYNKRFQEKNADKLKENITCPICYGTYTYFNKSKHLKSQRHIRACEIKESEKRTADFSPIPNIVFPNMAILE